MKKTLLFLFVSIVSQPLLATSIVVLITPHYIIIGADSKRMIIDAENNFTSIQTVCKIRSVNNYCYAAAGFTASGATFYSADSIIQFHLKAQKQIEKALRLIKRDIAKALKKELLFQKNNQPKQYKKTMEMQRHILEIVILSMDNAILQAHILGFEMADEEKTTIKAYTAKSTNAKINRENQFFFLGEYSGMEKYLNAKHENTDPVWLVNQLILSQSKITPSSVGAPVSLVKFTNNGMEWLNNLCDN